MTKITAINETKRGRMALFSEGEFLFSLDAETFAKSGVAVGDVLSEMDLLDLRDASETRKAKDVALRYLSRRAYAERELYEKLAMKYDEASVSAAMLAMREAGLLDDKAFAAAKAEALAENGKSAGDIFTRLLALGVDRDIAHSAADACSIDEEALAMELVENKYRGKLAEGKAQNVMAALSRRGFKHGTIQTAVRAVQAQVQAQIQAETEAEGSAPED